MLPNLLTLGEVLEKVPYTRAHIYRLIKAGHFPKSQVLPGTNQDVWNEADIVEWIKALPFTKRNSQ